jgi:hypothetical protein
MPVASAPATVPRAEKGVTLIYLRAESNQAAYFKFS